MDFFEGFVITYLIIALILFLVFLVFTWGINWTWNFYQEISQGFVVSILWGLIIIYILYEIKRTILRYSRERR